MNAVAQMDWIYDDGGRGEAGFRGHTGDCLTRAIAIVTHKPYRLVYCEINKAAKRERPRKGKSRSSARTGVYKATAKLYLESIGLVWTPTMFVGQGCKVHLRADELPSGRLIVALSKHWTAVVDGIVRDTYIDDRDGTRCVYGYWK